MNLYRFIVPAMLLMITSLLTGCEKGVSPIGGSIASGEVSITIDSLEYDLKAVTFEESSFDARSGNVLLGRINVPEYGKLDCSFVTRLLSVTQLPDSLKDQEVYDRFLSKLDSCAVQLYLVRGNFVGDSLAPQQAKVFLLNKQLPDNITNNFNPSGYYDPYSPLSVKNYTLSHAGATDNAFLNAGFYQIQMLVDKQFAIDIFDKYRSDPAIFNWPQDFATFIPGLYIENSFGKGCMASFSQLTLNAYFYKLAQQAKKDSDGNTVKDSDGNIIYETVHKKDSIVLCTTAPEVLSSNRILYTPSESLKQRIASGETILTTPGGFRTSFTFPAKEILEKYNDRDFNISVIGGLTMTIPADTVKNDYSLLGASDILMVKTSELDNFFATNSVPDNKTSFYASYNSAVGGYRFSSLRTYLLNLMAKDEILPEDVTFTLVPVSVTSETSSTGSYTYVTKCVPYTARPTITKLDTQHARIVFTFSSQLID